MKKISIIFLIVLALSSCGVFINQDNAQKTGSDSSGYKMITVSVLQNLMKSENFTLVNVHIPFEGNIPGTDLNIPYNEVQDFLNLLPENKDEKIVLYCRSGSMGDTASKTLVGLGYTDVSNLEGGYNAWIASGLPFEE